jgi:hypothetical protein
MGKYVMLDKDMLGKDKTYKKYSEIIPLIEEGAIELEGDKILFQENLVSITFNDCELVKTFVRSKIQFDAIVKDQKYWNSIIYWLVFTDDQM